MTVTTGALETEASAGVIDRVLLGTRRHLASMDEVRETIEDLEDGDRVTIVTGPRDSEASYQGDVVAGGGEGAIVQLDAADEHGFARVRLAADEEARRGVIADFARRDEMGPEPTREVLDLVRR